MSMFAAPPRPATPPPPPQRSIPLDQQLSVTTHQTETTANNIVSTLEVWKVLVLHEDYPHGHENQPFCPSILF